jgi:hypothetical protein
VCVRGRTLGLYLPALFKDVVRGRMPACILGERRDRREHQKASRSSQAYTVHCT